MHWYPPTTLKQGKTTRIQTQTPEVPLGKGRRSSHGGQGPMQNAVGELKQAPN